MQGTVFTLLTAVPVVVCTGCIGDEGLLTSAESVPGSDTLVLNMAADLSPGTDADGVDEDASAATDATQSTRSKAEQTALQNLLSGLASDAASGSASGLLDGALSLSDMKRLGLGRRDIAVLALDVVGQRTDLTPEQSFALRFARALLSGDQDALGQLLLQQLVSLLAGGSSVSDMDGATL